MPATMTQRVLIAVLAAAALVGGGLYLRSPHRPKLAQNVTPPTVETVHPRRVDLVSKVDSNATIEAFETADLYPKVSGYLSTVSVDIGDHVKSGQLLAVIVIPELEKEFAEDKAQLEAKRANLALQKTTLRRQEDLFNGHGITEQAFDEIRAKTAIAAADADVATATVARVQTMLSYTRILAPFDGVVARRLVNRGDFVQAATAARTSPLFTVQQISTIRVFCEVPESDVSQLKIGDAAAVKPYGMVGKEFTGKIARFAYKLDIETRTMRTEVDLSNPQEVLYPGMYAQVSLETERHPNALALPASSIVADGEGSFVNLIRDHHVQHQRVKTGMTDAGLIEILEGLPEDAEVVKSGKSAPPAGAEVYAVIQDVP
jgi:RND family efflux transporter MFP subunit